MKLLLLIPRMVALTGMFLIKNFIFSYSMMLMVIHFLQCAVDPPILPNLIGLFPEMFDGSIDVDELQYNVPLKLPGLFKFL